MAYLKSEVKVLIIAQQAWVKLLGHGYGLPYPSCQNLYKTNLSLGRSACALFFCISHNGSMSFNANLTRTRDYLKGLDHEIEFKSFDKNRYFLLGINRNLYWLLNF
jgi:hypothetical protein